MISKRIGGLCAAFGLALGLGACVDDYGYGGLSLGYGDAGYYGDPYYDGYDGYGYPANYGWYGDYYYPGTGIYVYDSYRRPYRWNSSQQRYWSDRQRYRGRDWNGQGSWNGFDRRTPQQAFNGNRRPQGNGFVPNAGTQRPPMPGQWRGAGNGTSRAWQGQSNGANRGQWQGRGGGNGVRGSVRGGGGRRAD